MPQAVVKQDTERFDLKTLEGGFVELRRLSYGEVLRRRDIMQTMRQGGGGNGDREVEMDFHFSRIASFEMAKAVVDHNLEDHLGKKLNLGSEKDLTRLDPKVGQEIESLIDKMNGFSQQYTEEDEEPSFRGSSDASDSPQQDGPSKGG